MDKPDPRQTLYEMAAEFAAVVHEKPWLDSRDIERFVEALVEHSGVEFEPFEPGAK